MTTKTIQPRGGLVWDVCVKCGAPFGDAVQVVNETELKTELAECTDSLCPCGGELVINHSLPGVENGHPKLVEGKVVNDC